MFEYRRVFPQSIIPGKVIGSVVDLGSFDSVVEAEVENLQCKNRSNLRVVVTSVVLSPAVDGNIVVPHSN